MISRHPSADRVFDDALEDHLSVVRQIQERKDDLEAIAKCMAATLRAGRKILWCGNGGSAGDSQHLAAELVGRFRRERRGLASLALTTDTSVLTALANDYGYETVFARQVQAIGNDGDILVGISTSGNSRNVVASFEKAREMGITTVAFTGTDGGKIAPLADYLFAVASSDTARIQEAHILAGHMLCDWIELDLLEAESSGETAKMSMRGGELS